MNDMTIRSLALACAPKIAQRVEQVVLQTVRDELPGVIEQVLAEKWGGETFKIRAAKNPPSMRRDRDRAIRMKYTGHNAQALAHEFKVSVRTVMRIVAIK